MALVGLAAMVCADAAIAHAGDSALAGGNASVDQNFSPAALGGIYAFGVTTIQYLTFQGYPNGRVDPGVASNPNVAGVLLSYGWNAIETADGIFDWSHVDNEVGLVGGVGKKASIQIAAGVNAPTWLYQEGARSLNLTWDRSWGFTPCSTQKIPIPWDAVFLSKWSAFVAAFGARYDANPTVASVKLTGFNSETAELFLPHSVNLTISVSGYHCTSPNYLTRWQGVGYTRTRAEHAFNTIAAAFAAAFPNTPFEAMKGPSDFPPIDQNGNILPNTDGEDDQANTDVINAAVAHYGPQFVLANDGLSADWVWALETSYSGQINTGYQMVSNRMGDQLPAAVATGLASSPVYIEIATPDIDDPSQASTIASAAEALP